MILPDTLKPKEKDLEWLAPELFRRAAELYEQSENWQDAAECWSEAGEKGRAAELYLLSVDYTRAAPLFLAEGRYAEALDCYRRWLALIPEDDTEGQVTARLGLAASLLLRHMEPEAAQEAYHEARTLIERETNRSPLVTGHCWEALGAYGVTIGRNDLVQLGYEQALRRYGKRHNGERLRAAKDYLLAVRMNRLLAAEIETRLTEWRSRL